MTYPSEVWDILVNLNSKMISASTNTNPKRTDLCLCKNYSGLAMLYANRLFSKAYNTCMLLHIHNQSHVMWAASLCVCVV